MGKLLDTVIALCLTFFVVAMMGNSVMYSGSTSANKTTFNMYSQQANNTADLLNNENYTYTDTGDVNENFKVIMNDLQKEVAKSQTSLNEGGIDAILSAFGIMSSFAIAAGKILLTVIVQGVNLTAGIAINLGSLPAPWNVLGVIGYIAGVLILVYLVFKVIEFLRVGSA